VDACFTSLESILHQKLAGKLKRTLLLLTADHGQVQTDPAATIYLNRTLPELERLMLTNRRGRTLAPAGSCRDMFLHIAPQHLQFARSMLQELLSGRAEVYVVADLIADGFFGSEPPSDTFLARVGNLVILPQRQESVWWYEEGRFRQGFFGNHGGMTADEMETELLALRYR
jgi:hypothetical protein